MFQVSLDIMLSGSAVRHSLLLRPCLVSSRFSEGKRSFFIVIGNNRNICNLFDRFDNHDVARTFPYFAPISGLQRELVVAEPIFKRRILR